MMRAEEIVAGQLAAYNDRDLEAFLAYWGAKAQIFHWPDTLAADGLDAIRSAHAARFAEPYLHAALLSRVAVDDLVVDREVVTRTESDRAAIVDVIAIYEVTDQRIQRAWFKSSTGGNPQE